MTERKPICLVVGADRVDTMPRKYFGNAGVFLESCRRVSRKHSRIFTSDKTVVTGFKALHKLGEIKLIVQRVVDGVSVEHHVDVKGDFILPWPDQFFEIDFYLLFDLSDPFNNQG